MKTVTDGDGLFAPMFNSLASLWLAGTAVLSGCTLTGSGSALQITVGAGTATAAGESVTVGEGTAAVTANAGTETRYDLLYATGAGALGIALGGTSTPALPGGCIPLAVLEIGPGQTTVPADRIHDCRALASLVVAAAATITALTATTVTATTISGNLNAVKFTGTAGSTVVKSVGGIAGPSLGGGTITTVGILTMPPGLQASPLRFRITASNENDYSEGLWGIRVLVGGVQRSDSTSVVSADVSVEGGDVVTLQVHTGVPINAYSITGYLQIGVLSPVVEIVAPVW